MINASRKPFFFRVIILSLKHETVGQHSMDLVQQAIQIYTTMLESSCTKACASYLILLWSIYSFKERLFELAEPHLLAAGKRDSARLLAHLLVDWSNGASNVGLYASRGVIPYVSNSYNGL